VHAPRADPLAGHVAAGLIRARVGRGDGAAFEVAARHVDGGGDPAGRAMASAEAVARTEDGRLGRVVKRVDASIRAGRALVRRTERRARARAAVLSLRTAPRSAADLSRGATERSAAVPRGRTARRASAAGVSDRTAVFLVRAAEAIGRTEAGRALWAGATRPPRPAAHGPAWDTIGTAHALTVDATPPQIDIAARAARTTVVGVDRKIPALASPLGFETTLVERARTGERAAPAVAVGVERRAHAIATVFARAAHVVGASAAAVAVGKDVDTLAVAVRQTGWTR